jgi:hypothetical protein
MSVNYSAKIGYGFIFDNQAFQSLLSDEVRQKYEDYIRYINDGNVFVGYFAQSAESDEAVQMKRQYSLPNDCDALFEEILGSDFVPKWYLMCVVD